MGIWRERFASEFVRAWVAVLAALPISYVVSVALYRLVQFDRISVVAGMLMLDVWAILYAALTVWTYGGADADRLERMVSGPELTGWRL